MVYACGSAECKLYSGFMGATRDFRKNIYATRDFYMATMHSYGESGSSLINNLDEYITIDLTPRDSLKDFSHQFTRTYRPADLRKSFKSEFSRILRESVLVRLMSSLEEYLISVTKLVFTNDPDTFGNIQTKLDIHANHIYALGSMSEIKSYILLKELRKLQDMSIKEKSEYLKRYLLIDVTSDTLLWSRISEYSARRNVVVHRLGKTDDKYAKDYNYNDDLLYVSNTYILGCIHDLISLSTLVGQQLRIRFDDRKPHRFTMGNPKIVLSLKIEDPNLRLMNDDFAFQSKNGIVNLRDLAKLSGDEDDLTLVLEGKNDHIDHFLLLVKQWRNKKRISSIKYLYIYRYTDKKPILDLDIINFSGEIYEESEDKDLVHIEIASKTGLSNNLVSLALKSYIHKPTEEEDRIIREFYQLNNRFDYLEAGTELSIPFTTVAVSRTMYRVLEAERMIMRSRN